eukprot:SAG11_NODE_346_length_10432_cov_4.883770_3_plen_880_part_00
MDAAIVDTVNFNTNAFAAVSTTEPADASHELPTAARWCVADAELPTPQPPELRAGQVWGGQYTCTQGATAFSLEVLELSATEQKAIPLQIPASFVNEADVGAGAPLIDEEHVTSVVGSRLAVLSPRGVWRVGVVTDIFINEDTEQSDGVRLDNAADVDGEPVKVNRPTCSLCAAAGPMLRVNFEGFNERWDEWIPQKSARFARHVTSVVARFNFSYSKLLLDCSGSFRLQGYLRGGYLSLLPVGGFDPDADGWQRNPCNFSAIGLRGSVNTTSQPGSYEAFGGDVVDTARNCKQFEAWLRPPPYEFDVVMHGSWQHFGVDGLSAKLVVAPDGVHLEIPDEGRVGINVSDISNAAAIIDLLRSTDTALEEFSESLADEADLNDFLLDALQFHQLPAETDNDDDEDVANVLAQRQRLAVMHDENGIASLKDVRAWLQDEEDAANGRSATLVRALTARSINISDSFSFPYKRIKGWSQHANEKEIGLEIKRVTLGEVVYETLLFGTTEGEQIKHVLAKHANFVLTSQGDAHKTIKSEQPLAECDHRDPFAKCDHRTRSSSIRRTPSVVFTSEAKMEDESAWPLLRAALVMTESSIYFFEGYSFHYGAYWRYEGEDEDNGGKPNYPLTEQTLRKHAPLWLYVHVFCENSGAGPRRISGSKTLNTACSPKIAQERARHFATTAQSYGLGLFLWLRVHVLLVNASVWLMHTLQLFLSHSLLWFFVYVPTAYVAVNLLRHVDTPTATWRTVAAVSAFTYTPSILFNDLLALIWLRFESSQLPGQHPYTLDVAMEVLHEMLDSFWWQLAAYVCWSCAVFVQMRAQAEQEKRAELLRQRGPREERQPPQPSSGRAADPDEDFGDPTVGKSVMPSRESVCFIKILTTIL